MYKNCKYLCTKVLQVLSTSIPRVCHSQSYGTGLSGLVISGLSALPIAQRDTDYTYDRYSVGP